MPGQPIRRARRAALQTAIDEAVANGTPIPTDLRKPRTKSTKAGGHSLDKTPRPEWWSPAEIVRRLQSGQYIGDICKLAAREMLEQGYQIVPNTLRADVGKWAESASWGEQVRRALKIVRIDGFHIDKGPQLDPKAPWREEFWIAMETNNGNAAEAAESAGIGYGVVLALCDPRNKGHYDKDFHQRFRIAEAQRVGRIREDYFQKAEPLPGVPGSGNEKVQAKILETHAPALHAPRQELVVSGTVGHEHTHSGQVTLAHEVVMASQQRMRVLQQGRTQTALPEAKVVGEGRIIDISKIAEAVPVTVEELS